MSLGADCGMVRKMFGGKVRKKIDEEALLRGGKRVGEKERRKEGRSER